MPHVSHVVIRHATRVPCCDKACHTFYVVIQHVSRSLYMCRMCYVVVKQATCYMCYMLYVLHVLCGGNACLMWCMWGFSMPRALCGEIINMPYIQCSTCPIWLYVYAAVKHAKYNQYAVLKHIPRVSYVTTMYQATCLFKHSFAFRSTIMTTSFKFCLSKQNACLL